MKIEYLWASLGLLLIGAEMLLPGVYLMWLGIAALLTSSSLMLVGGEISLLSQALMFSGFSFLLMFLASRHKKKISFLNPNQVELNNKYATLIGRKVVLPADVHTQLTIVIDDSHWRIDHAHALEFQPGQYVIVSSVDKNTGLVELKALSKSKSETDVE